MSEETTNQTTEETPQNQEPQKAPEMGRGASNLQLLMKREAEARAATEEAKKHKSAVEDAYRIRDLAKNNPAAFLQQMGVDPSSLNPDALRPDPLEDVQSKLSNLEKQLLQEREEKRQWERQQAIESARADVVSMINDSEEFQFTKASGLQDAVFDRLLQAHEAGQAISEVEAAREVEEALVEHVVPKFVQLVLENDALREKYAPGYVKQGQLQRPKQTPLTNDLSSEVAVKQTGLPKSQSDWEDSFASMLRFDNQE